MKNKEIKTKRKSLLPLLLTILIMLLAFVACAVAIGTSGNDDDSETVEVSAVIPKKKNSEISETTEKATTTENITTTSKTTQTTEKTTATTKTTTSETTTTTITTAPPATEPPTTAEVSHRDGMVGISDKKFTDDNFVLFDSSVRNDNTGKWRLARISELISIQEYALDYYNEYFKSQDEIHAVVNFANNTTSQISIVAGMIDVTVHEYVKGEEHDANLLFSGTVLEEYFVYTDNGDIEKIR